LEAIFPAVPDDHGKFVAVVRGAYQNADNARRHPVMPADKRIGKRSKQWLP